MFKYAAPQLKHRFATFRAMTIEKPFRAVLIAVAIMFLVEVAAQVRSQIKLGQSIFNRIAGESHYVVESSTGLLLLRPNATFGGSQQSIRSNQYGLRSNEIPVDKPTTSFRVAVVGASTVMGAYARDNDSTFPALLEAKLRKMLNSESVEVINAGVVGLALRQQVVLLERLVLKFNPDVVILYPGFNDFSGYCRQFTDVKLQREGLVDITLPRWLLSIELLQKNTVFLREARAQKGVLMDADSIDISPYEATLQRLFEVARANKVSLVVATIARGFRRDQPLQVQVDLAQTARYYNPCFDIDGLHRLHERHNEAIAKAAEGAGIKVVRLDRSIPGGKKYFVDSNHFSATGEDLAAEQLAIALAEYQLLPKSLKP